MSFLSSIKKVLNIGQSDSKKRRNFPHIKEGVDPLVYWDIVGELGDGAFGKVHKAQHKEDGRFAAAKICTIESDEELTDFTVEIDILHDLSHNNIIRLFDAFYNEDKLWVSEQNYSQRFSQNILHVSPNQGRIIAMLYLISATLQSLERKKELNVVCVVENLNTGTAGLLSY